jgi:hypothetical protein
MLAGLVVVGFSNKIVFPGLERLIGIETIVGKDNVVYQPDGSYLFTNPRRMVEWIGAVILLGVLMISFGIWLSGIRLKLPSKNGDQI